MKIYVVTVWVELTFLCQLVQSRNFENCQINVQWYKKNQMHAYEMSYKCQLYSIHTVAT
jgi:hypothetical protein